MMDETLPFLWENGCEFSPFRMCGSPFSLPSRNLSDDMDTLDKVGTFGYRCMTYVPSEHPTNRRFT